MPQAMQVVQTVMDSKQLHMALGTVSKETLESHTIELAIELDPAVRFYM